ncbi:class I SAM-dependent methyltransferase [Reichenbachiella agariperforans]|uniref:class I SAM-dependent methyltransferase n=1 Tax=Reichenbachiella agariperforans TaxID=156994 RepID=UPI001C080157|nr:class I SAM-dependent methyltransferase [Reichenbachiella agariperforans]MBU2914656.1 class I SAM-dependent methyltransferase [Reichenbachiella agariperforans]
MYEKIDSCPSCNYQEFTNHIICDDHSLTHESFAIMKCKNCELLITSPRPSKGAIGKYYQFEDYISHTNKATNPVNWIYKLVRNHTINTKFKLIQSLSDKETILDYGCGTAQLLKYIKEQGWKVTGIEPDQNARTIAQKNIGDTVFENIDKLPAKKYGIISLWHVLEHVHDINETLQALKQHLSKKSRLIVAVPNSASYDQRFYKKHWAAYDVPRHLYHFNQETITALMKYNGYKLEATHPMKFDSFYVSLLSEKYKTGQSNYFKAFCIGLLSNRWAKKNNHNYSSIIYIFKKV